MRLPLHLGAAVLATVTAATASLPAGMDKVRGVNLGGLFVSEPWMMAKEWKSMGCTGFKSENDCLAGNSSAQAGFSRHYASWITERDIAAIASWGLNTVRVPLGFWIVESLVEKDSEHFPTGGFAYLERLLGWCVSYGVGVMLDLHGAPGAQVASNPDTGYYLGTPGFYSNTTNYERAYAFLANLTTEAHTNANFATVFALEVLNEPIQSSTKTGDMRSVYYPGALNAIRSAEADLGLTCDTAASRMTKRGRPLAASVSARSAATSATLTNPACLNVQFMDKKWGAGDPSAYLPSTSNVLFESHSYVMYAAPTLTTRAGYLNYSCAHNVSAANSAPVVVGEFSLTVTGGDAHAELAKTSEGAAAFYLRWFSAQVADYERAMGWVFWTYKTDTLNTPRWDYTLSRAAGYVPANASEWDRAACQ